MNGSVVPTLYASTMNSGGRVDSGYTPEEIDVYAVYSEDTSEVYWVPIEDTGKGEMRLRAEDPTSLKIGGGSADNC